MRKLKIKNHLSPEDLEEKMLSAQDKEQFKRWQAIYLAYTTQRSIKDISKIVKMSDRNIYTVIKSYNNNGVEGVILKKRGGRREASSHMTLEEEANLLKELIETASEGLIITSKRVKEKAEEKLGYEVSKDYPYDLLHRHGWRRVMPRPAHPSRKEEEQKNFKKTFPTWWQKL